MNRLVSIAVIAAASSAVTFVTASERREDRHDFRRSSPLVIGHRGATGYLTEHTLEAYRLAIAAAPISSSRTWSRRGTGC